MTGAVKQIRRASVGAPRQPGPAGPGGTESRSQLIALDSFKRFCARLSARAAATTQPVTVARLLVPTSTVGPGVPPRPLSLRSRARAATCRAAERRLGQARPGRARDTTTTEYARTEKGRGRGGGTGHWQRQAGDSDPAAARAPSRDPALPGRVRL